MQHFPTIITIQKMAENGFNWSNVASKWLFLALYGSLKWTFTGVNDCMSEFCDQNPESVVGLKMGILLLNTKYSLKYREKFVEITALRAPPCAVPPII